MDPFSLIAGGVGMAGGLASGIYNAATLPGKKRRYIKSQREQALLDLARARTQEGGLPTYSVDADARMRQIKSAANENFKLDPTTFLPFVQGASQFGGALYNGIKEDQAFEAAQPNAQYRTPQASYTPTPQDELERAQAYRYFQRNGLEPYR